MKNQKNEIMAYMVKKKNGNLYKVPGTIININESQKTADMSFIKKDGKKTIIRNISQKEIFINEDFRDNIRNFSSNVVNTVKKVGASIKNFFKSLFVRVGRFLLLKTADGSLDGAGMSAFVNVAACKAPKGVTFVPSKSLQKINNSIRPVNIEDAVNNYLANNDDQKPVTESVKSGKNKRYINEDIAEIHKFWYGFMDYVKKPKNRVKSMNECMRSYKAMYEPINETVLSLKTSDTNEHIKNINTKELYSVIEQSVRDQRRNAPGESANAKSPVLIWGAPGIGKTAIIKQAGDFVAKSLDQNHGMSLILVNSASVMPDTFQLPTIQPNEVRDKRVTGVPNSWLPMYKVDKSAMIELEVPKDDDPNSTETEIIRMPRMHYLDFFYNTGRLPEDEKQFDFYKDYDSTSAIEFVQSNKEENDGGIIFFDEFSRMSGAAKDLIMTIVLERKATSGDMVLASHWAILAAANRKTDLSGEGQENFTWETAYATRFTQYNYVPEMGEWLEWAKAINPKTGESNVDPVITDFLESAEVGNHIWYDALDFGSRNAELEKSGLKQPNINNISSDDARAILDDPNIANIMTSWNPRTWTNISNTYRDTLKYLLGELNDTDSYNDTAAGQLYARMKRRAQKKAGVQESLSSSLLEAKKNKFDPNTGAVNAASGEFSSDPSLKPSKEELLKRWNHFYELNAKTCDPRGLYKEYTESNVKRFLVSWLENIVIPGNHGTNNVTERGFKKYNEFLNVFTKEQLNNIWNYGSMMLQDENGVNKDDLAGSVDFFLKDNDLKWKGNTKFRREVLELILSNYPGSMDADFKKSLKMSLAYKDKPLAETLVSQDVFDKWVNEIFSFKIIPTDKSGKPINKSGKTFNISYMGDQDGESCFASEPGAYDAMFKYLAEQQVGKSAEAFNKFLEKSGQSVAATNIKIIYTFNNFIDMLEKGDKFSRYIVNYIKYLTKVTVEGDSMQNHRILELQIIGNTDEVFNGFSNIFDGADKSKNKEKNIDKYDFDSYNNSLIQKLNPGNLLKETYNNPYMYYVLCLKLLLRAVGPIFTMKKEK